VSNPVNAVTQSQPVQNAPQASTAAVKTPPAQAASTSTDTVTISSSAKAILQEVQETHAQTVQEASGGDSQAKRALAKEAAAQQLTKS
jgi:hypothetical protein